MVTWEQVQAWFAADSTKIDILLPLGSLTRWQAIRTKPVNSNSPAGGGSRNYRTACLHPNCQRG